MQEGLNTGIIPTAVPAPKPSAPPYVPLVSFRTADDIARDAAEAAALDKQAQKPAATPSLLQHVADAYATARRDRETSGVDKKLLDAQERRASKYSAEVAANIKKHNQPDKYFPLTAQKCHDGEAWWNDIEASVGERAISIEPTPIANLDDLATDAARAKFAETFNTVSEAMTEAGQPMGRSEVAELFDELIAEQSEAISETAVQRADKMRRLILDQLHDANYPSAKQDFKSNILTYGTGFLKGPVVRMRAVGKWNGTDYAIEKKPLMTVEAPSPNDIFPSPESVDIDDGFICERTMVPRHELEQFANDKAKYWYPDNIRAILNESAVTGITPEPQNYDSNRRELENKPSTPQSKVGGMVECIEFWGRIQGKLLSDFGYKGLDDAKSYPFHIIWHSQQVLKVMPNPDPLGRVPYYKSVFRRVPGSFWGLSPAECIATAQDGANGAYRALVKNMAFASGPMVARDQERLVNANAVNDIEPWGTIFFKTRPGDTSKALEFWQADDRSRQLIVAIDKFVEWADRHSGIPPFVPSADAMAAWGRTARGVGMLLSAAGRGMKDMIGDADKAEAMLLERWYIWNMLYHDDASVKGDAQVVTRGTLGVLIAEMQEQRIETLITQLTNPSVVQVIGPEAAAEALREFATIMRMDGIAKVIPDAKQIADRIAQQTATAPEPEPEETEADRELKMSAAEKNRAKAEETRMNAPIKAQKLVIEKAKTVHQLARSAGPQQGARRNEPSWQ